MTGLDDNPAGRFKLALASGWGLLLTGYVVWGTITGRGLVGWLAAHQIAASGSYSGTLTFVLPIIVLGFPAWWALFGHFARIEAANRGSPERQRRYARKWGIALGTLACAGVATMVFAVVRAAVMPDGSEPTVPVTHADIEAGRIPPNRVRIVGAQDSFANTAATERGRFGKERHMAYTGFRPGDAAGEAMSGAGRRTPIRVFLLSTIDEGPGSIEVVSLPFVEGYLVENDLPGFARKALSARGIRIAEPHYLLDQSYEGPRSGWYTLAAFSGFMAMVLVAVAAMAIQFGGRAAAARENS